MDGALRPWTELGLRCLVGGLFIVAGVLKALDPAAFLQAIDGYRFLPGALASICAVFLPWLEIFCGVGLVLRRCYSGALALVTGLTVVFIAALLSAWLRGLDIDCGCFGSGDPSGRVKWALLRDVVLLGALAWLWRSAAKKNAPGFPGA